MEAAEVTAEFEVGIWAAVDELLLVPENDKATSGDLSHASKLGRQ